MNRFELYCCEHGRAMLGCLCRRLPVTAAFDRSSICSASTHTVAAQISASCSLCPAFVLVRRRTRARSAVGHKFNLHHLHNFNLVAVFLLSIERFAVDRIWQEYLFVCIVLHVNFLLNIPSRGSVGWYRMAIAVQAVQCHCIRRTLAEP